MSTDVTYHFRTLCLVKMKSTQKNMSDSGLWIKIGAFFG